jgi:hypothetical protein
MEVAAASAFQRLVAAEVERRAFRQRQLEPEPTLRAIDNGLEGRR